ncbi:C2 domain-containing protein [Ceratobasidium sp. AG-Ba]|nr:C2 domain-containing protein [Ceratobasidium sp. AG-Ba]
MKLYDVQIIFHSAHALPVSDVPSLSADPYILASLRVPAFDRDEPGPPPLQFRTKTIHRTRDPDWGNEVWRVGGVPESGFALRIGVRDEDAGKKDDRLGEARVSFFGTEAANKLKGDDSEKDADADWGKVREGLDIARREAPIKKRRGGARAFVSTYVTAMVSKGVSPKSATVAVSVRVLGPSANQEDQRVYTLGPNYYSLHFSPLLGKMIGTKSANASKTNKPKVSNFQANKLQLTGPVPKELEHRYVGYRPFIESLFSKSGLKGRILNRALKKQHRYVYSHDQSTVYGCVDRHQHAANVDPDQSNLDQSSSSPESKPPISDSQPAPSNNQHHHSNDVNPLAAQFLRMVQHGAGHRLYTYVITLDAQWRFTETGDEFAIEMLSKHSMHADAARHIAYSGEMFIRRIGTQGWEADETEEADAQADTAQDGENRPRVKKHPPSSYELVIDNDSGTYRPHKELLPVLEKFLGGEANLGGPGGVGKITAMDGFDESLKDIKKRRAEAKKGQGEERRQVQIRRSSSGSVSSVGSMSSDEVERVVRDGQQPNENRPANGGEQAGDLGVAAQVKHKIGEQIGKAEEVKGGVKEVVGR